VEFPRLGLRRRSGSRPHITRSSGWFVTRRWCGSRLCMPWLAWNNGLSRPRPGLRSGLELPRLWPAAWVPGGRLRLGRGHRFERLGFAWHKLLVGGQLLNLLGHVRSQRHGGPGRQGRTRQTPARSDRYRLKPGNLGIDPRHPLGGRQEIGLIQVGLGHPDIGYRMRRRQGLTVN
jgi:hypothetical protein